MLRSNATSLTGFVISERLTSLAKKISMSFENMRNSLHLFSEDAIYKHNFKNTYMPALYRKHCAEMTANCVFCAHLSKTGCHRQCLKCGVGTYTHCSPLLPGQLSSESIYTNTKDELGIPWYYTETCSSFRRLPQENYFRNFHPAFSSISIFNYETLESLEKGLLSGEKPCHVCASTDYEIYRKCSGQGDFDLLSPCHKIVDELAEFYRNQNNGTDINKEAS